MVNIRPYLDRSGDGFPWEYEGSGKGGGWAVFHLQRGACGVTAGRRTAGEGGQGGSVWVRHQSLHLEQWYPASSLINF